MSQINYQDFEFVRNGIFTVEQIRQRIDSSRGTNRIRFISKLFNHSSYPKKQTKNDVDLLFELMNWLVANGLSDKMMLQAMEKCLRAFNEDDISIFFTRLEIPNFLDLASRYPAFFFEKFVSAYYGLPASARQHLLEEFLEISPTDNDQIVYFMQSIVDNLHIIPETENINALISRLFFQIDINYLRANASDILEFDFIHYIDGLDHPDKFDQVFEEVFQSAGLGAVLSFTDSEIFNTNAVVSAAKKWLVHNSVVYNELALRVGESLDNLENFFDQDLADFRATPNEIRRLENNPHFVEAIKNLFEVRQLARFAGCFGFSFNEFYKIAGINLLINNNDFVAINNFVSEYGDDFLLDVIYAEENIDIKDLLLQKCSRALQADFYACFDDMNIDSFGVSEEDIQILREIIIGTDFPLEDLDEDDYSLLGEMIFDENSSFSVDGTTLTFGDDLVGYDPKGYNPENHRSESNPESRSNRFCTERSRNNTPKNGSNSFRPINFRQMGL